ncbi:helix-turn-helix domain-containing protein [Thiothrix winogradskyi]|uniref:Helix-turn-helix domain-containing protein n=1 Tax=Thiothrix winogradskyi TaxID=96472 RepID=A0ABY3SUG1_9GAMM|nr:helix-turn-helix transcriptional regulator [Thiothrix winogradskyi]UJS23151.1 helix-turn-helix domain-containing protein [Thiothrix winogradskyi]
MKKDKSIHDLRYHSLVEALTSERKRLNISQAELANKVGMNQSDISKIEQLERRLDVLEFVRILEAFRISENKNFSEKITALLGMEI